MDISLPPICGKSSTFGNERKKRVLADLTNVRGAHPQCFLDGLNADTAHESRDVGAAKDDRKKLHHQFIDELEREQMGDESVAAFHHYAADAARVEHFHEPRKIDSLFAADDGLDIAPLQALQI